MAKFSINLKEGKINNETELIIGIDLGTTNSLVAYIKDGVPVTVKNEEQSSSLLPSIVHFGKENAILVGDAAKERIVTDPANTVYSVKRLMGKSFGDVAEFKQYFGYQVIDEDTESLVKIRVKDRFYSPIALSAIILKELKKRIETNLNQTVNKAVITVPAYFNDVQRQATRDAGKLAGLDVLRIVNEPTAASLAYGITVDKSEGQTIAVYDLGGGTFDISILHIEDGIFEVLATNGDTFLGGDDLDRAIVEIWTAKNKLDAKTLHQNKQLSQHLRLKAEEAKKTLSHADKFEETHEGLTLNLSKDEFETAVKPLIERTIKHCATALKDAELDTNQIDHVIMVGGSTRTPLVKKLVADYFKMAVNDTLDPDQVVAMGAAIQADILAGNQRELLLLDVTPLSLGIETVGGLMDVIIPRNSKIPSKAGRQYTTSVDGQKNLKVSVYQGERDLVEHNRKLGEFILKNIPPMPAGLPKIDIQFILDADGILKVKASELRSATEQSIAIKSPYSLSEEEMAKMLIDSIQHAEQDMKDRALLEARNEAQNILLSTEKFLKQHQNILNETEIERTTELATMLKEAKSGTDKDAINKAMAELNEFTAPLAHRAMDHTIAEAMKGKKI